MGGLVVWARGLRHAYIFFFRPETRIIKKCNLRLLADTAASLLLPVAEAPQARIGVTFLIGPGGRYN
jgi:hypothetical protein